jgi:hypothetical protein
MIVSEINNSAEDNFILGAFYFNSNRLVMDSLLVHRRFH